MDGKFGSRRKKSPTKENIESPQGKSKITNKTQQKSQSNRVKQSRLVSDLTLINFNLSIPRVAPMSKSSVNANALQCSTTTL